ncbi:branched-chain amino acid ABC transporter permease [Sedimenticola selenatireducens]|uniref:Branched-chain amino acid ABC transporter permease n=1 Tax=Sedimenticola selenatireducens TaxID=191960 RepID=A0A558DUY3_9GAMM|nr:branched-chain amino acid ABC transporter permease [Sedimenticola selenatireducens]TVO72535.1 branched-chain amino acid ABC transporter permease [Sedimenticola selenatireducens]TVT64789.1 MAG: branched-chain amino acid ABC transporter permease [Sedimenticola selenatireducens]
MHTVTRPIIIFLCICLVLLLLFPAVGGPFYTELVTKIMILSIFTISLDLLIGFTGLVSFGHAAFFGIGAYLLAILFNEVEHINYWWSLTLTLSLTGLAALVIGWLSIRTSGIYFIMLTLAFAQMCFYFFFESPHFGGDDGIFLANKPEIKFGTHQLIDLENEHHYYYFVLAWLVGVYLFLSMILRAPFGHVLIAIKANEQRVRALGYSTPHYKLVSFVIAGTIAGLAGFLEAAHTSFVTPAYLGWHESGMAIMMVILGGMGTLFGPVIGTFIVVLLQDFLPNFTEHWKLIMGGIIIGVVLFLPNGIAGLIYSISNRFTSSQKEHGREHV